MDESVANVQIPEGSYRISAQSEAYNLVSVPVKIEAGKTRMFTWKPLGKFRPVFPPMMWYICRTDTRWVGKVH